MQLPIHKVLTFGAALFVFSLCVSFYGSTLVIGKVPASVPLIRWIADDGVPVQSQESAEDCGDQSNSPGEYEDDDDNAKGIYIPDFYQAIVHQKSSLFSIGWYSPVTCEIITPPPKS